MRHRISLLVLTLAIVALGATGESKLKVSAAWVRPTPPGAPTAAVYATIRNDSAAADRLIAVESDAAEAAELHRMSTKDGMMVMEPVHGGIAVPAHGTVRLEPGGYHIMLVHPTQPIHPGDTVHVTLVFEKAGRVALSIEAKMDGREGGAMPGMLRMDGQPAPDGAAPPKPAMGGMGHGPAMPMTPATGGGTGNGKR